jgi:hypothetical protein
MGVVAEAATGLAVVVAQTVKVSPDPGALPGGAQLQQIVNGLAGMALIALAGAAVAGAVLWAVGAGGSHSGAILGGKRMVLVAVAAALVVGATPALINFFRSLGGQL